MVPMDPVLKRRPGGQQLSPLDHIQGLCQFPATTPPVARNVQICLLQFSGDRIDQDDCSLPGFRSQPYQVQGNRQLGHMLEKAQARIQRISFACTSPPLLFRKYDSLVQLGDFQFRQRGHFVPPRIHFQVGQILLRAQALKQLMRHGNRRTRFQAFDLHLANRHPDPENPFLEFLGNQ